jgi:hypothetical protein
MRSRFFARKDENGATSHEEGKFPVLQTGLSWWRVAGRTYRVLPPRSQKEYMPGIVTYNQVSQGTWLQRTSSRAFIQAQS